MHLGRTLHGSRFEVDTQAFVASLAEVNDRDTIPVVLMGTYRTVLNPGEDVILILKPARISSLSPEDRL